MRTKLLLFLIVVLIAGLAFFWLQERTSTGIGNFRNFNVLLITIDTLRADHLPSYGYTNVQTPNIDALANESLVFENAVAHVPMTLPSHASILTGLLPPTHGIRDNAGFILDSKIKTLAEILKNQGYETAAFVSAFVLDSQFGLDQGFDLYSDSFTLEEGRIDNTDVFRRAEKTQIEVDSWLDQRTDQPFFLWVHYFDPHDPYNPPEPYKTKYATAPYDGEIAYTDSVVGKLIARIDQLQLKEKTIVIMTADHGEGLGEHKEQTHSIFIYNSTQHVPLMIRLPKGKHHRIKGVVNHIDIAPTILEWLGIESDHAMQGESLIPIIQGKETTKREAYSESFFPELHYGWSPLIAITTEDYKFIKAPSPELYDMQNDRNELKNLISVKKELASNLKERLDRIAPSPPVQAKTQQIDPEAEEKLRALGYTGTIVKSTPETRKIDPKERIDLLEAVTRAHQAMDRKNYRLVIETTTWILQQEPNMIDAQFMLATSYLHLNEMEKAEIEMLKTIQLKPDHLQTLYNLGFFHQIRGNLTEAERWYAQLLTKVPGHLRAALNLVTVYRHKNEPAKAQKVLLEITNSYDEALKTTVSTESKSNLLEKLGQAYFATGDFVQSETKFRGAIELTPQRPMLHFHLGTIYEQKKQKDQAISEYEKEIEIDPDNYRAYFRLGILLRQKGRIGDAAECFKKVIQLDDRFYPAYYQLAETHLASNSNLEDALRLVETADRQTLSNRGRDLRNAITKRLRGANN